MGNWTFELIAVGLAMLAGTKTFVGFRIGKICSITGMRVWERDEDRFWFWWEVIVNSFVSLILVAIVIKRVFEHFG